MTSFLEYWGAWQCAPTTFPTPQPLLLLVLLLGISQSAYAQHERRADALADSLPSIALPSELDRVLRDYERGWSTRNANALAALFTPDGFILRSGHPPTRGRAAIAEAYRNSGGPLHLRAMAYAQSDSTGYIIGGYRSALNRPDSGKFILTLRKEPDGRWYITADMDNGNR